MEPQPGLAVRFDDGTEGRAEHYQAGTLLVVCPRAYPPGKPMALRVQLPQQGETALSGRCMGSKRQPDGGYYVRLRLTNLRREAREGLRSALG